MPVTVLFVQPMAERGGSDQALLRLVRTLPREDFEVHVAVPAPHPLAQEFAAAGARLHVVPMRRISTSHGAAGWLAYALSWPLSVSRLALLARRVRADVLYTNSLHSWYGFAAAFLARRPHVWHAREVVVQSGAALALERGLTARADLVLAGSQAIADQLTARRMVVVHEHPDPREFAPGHAGAFRGREGLPDDAVVAVLLARLDTWKGFEVALEAWPLVRPRVPEARLLLAGGVVAGKADYAEALRRRAAATPGVLWLGERRDVPELLADCDLLLAPSTLPEPYGLGLVEALASGCPVVASDAGGPREILAAAGPGAGVLVPTGDARALAVAVAGLLGPTSTTLRRGRPVLARPEPPPFARLLSEVAGRR